MSLLRSILLLFHFDIFESLFSDIHNHLTYKNRNDIHFFNESIKVDDINTRWRFVSEDVIPPIPELSLRINNYSLCLKENKIGLLSHFGDTYGQCGIMNNKIHYIDGGNFHILERVNRDNCINKKKDELEYHFNYLIRNFIKPENSKQIENITGYRFAEIKEDSKELTYCELKEILSATRFYNHKLNEKGLHLIRYILSENIYYHNLMNNDVDDDLRKWISDGILIKSLDTMSGSDYYGLMNKISLGKGIPSYPLDLIPRDIVIQEDDTQNILHMDTFSKIIKIWIFENNSNITEENGPLNFVKGTHRISYNKLRWMYDYGQETNRDVIIEPSFRLRNINNNTETRNYINEIDSLKIPIYPLNNTKRTIIFADTSAFHSRGKGLKGKIRKSLRIRGDTDGGIKRLNPFYLPKNKIYEIELDACNTDCGFVKIKVDREWYILKSYHWTMKESNVICKTLGFKGATTSNIGIKRNDTYKEINYDIKCEGNEININDCFVYDNLNDKSSDVSVGCYHEKRNITNRDDIIKIINESFQDNQSTCELSNTLPITKDLYIYSDEIEKKINNLKSDHYLMPRNDIIHYNFDKIVFNDIKVTDQESKIYNELNDKGLVYLDNIDFNFFIDTTNNINISKISNESIITIYRKIPELDIILHNETINKVIKKYLGGRAEISGYKLNILDIKDNDYNKYISSYWHHDNVGRRLKLFLLLSDIHCIHGHPTQIAIRTNKISYHFTDSFIDTRFTDKEIKKRFDIKSICGKKGDIFLFDTNAIHRGVYEGKYKRNLIIIEYHNDLKCQIANFLKLKVPCPSGDQYMINQKL
jgi:hypothetical protein